MISMYGFIAMASLIAAVPGVDTMVVARNALRGGIGSALRTAAGVCSGLLVWALVSALGLAAVLAASGALITAIKIAGAVYLIFLGTRAVVTSRASITAPKAQMSRSARWSGALTTFGNPKVGVFYTSFLPRFIPEHGNALLVSLSLAAIHIAISFVCVLGHASLVVRLGDIFQRGRWRQTLEIVIGTVQRALGVGIIANVVMGRTEATHGSGSTLGAGPFADAADPFGRDVLGVHSDALV